MTHSTGTVDGMIKQDTRGRMRVTGERREALLAEFDGSAMTGRKFAAWAGIKYSTFSNWLRARRKLPSPSALGAENAPGPRWLEAVVNGSADRKAVVKTKPGVLVVEESRDHGAVVRGLLIENDRITVQDMRAPTIESPRTLSAKVRAFGLIPTLARSTPI